MVEWINRREFLRTTALVVATTSPKQLTAAPSLAAVITNGFNGGRSQVNVNALLWGGAYPFLNVMKTAQTWTLNDGSGYPAPDTLDENGYPTAITNGGVYTVMYVPSQAARPGNYVITWSGNGTISCGMSNTRISGSLTSTTGTGRYVFATTDSTFVIRIVAVGNPHITNLSIFHVSDEALLAAGQVFSAKFKARLSEAKFGVIRFLAWQDGNTTNVTTWSTRKPVTYVYYNGQELRSSLYAGVTSNDGGTYSATLPGFRLLDKATVIVKFNASHNGPCTLNVNGTGDIVILNEYGEALEASSYPVGGTWQSLATVVYDATLNSWIKQGGDVAVGSCGIDSGCPPELMVRLCAEVGAHPHFVTPPLSIDPATDYMPNLAAYCRAAGPSWMIPRFEGPNETWNFGGGFYQTHYAAAKAAAYGWGPDYHNWYGKVMSVLGQIVSSAYGGDSRKFQVLCGVQTAYGNTQINTSTHDPRLTAEKYVRQTAPAQAPYTKSPASNWVTHVCCAQYLTPSEYNTAQEAIDAASYAVAAGNVTLQTSIASAYASTVNSGSGMFTVNSVATMYANWKAWALSHRITKMCGYEGGYSPDYGGGQQIDALRSASKQAPVLQTITTMNYNNFVGLSDTTFTAEFPSCFQLSGQSPSGNAWSVLEDIFQSPNPPQWIAITAFNQATH